MTNFDKKIKELSKDMKIPENYNRRIEEVLQTIPETESVPQPKGRRVYKKLICVAVCIVCFACLFSMNESKVGAGLLEEFKTTILSILNLGEEEPEELGVESNKTNIVSKPDLLIELKETVIDKQNIYVMIQITAPTDIAFTEEIGFEYFAFCEGDNYITDKIIDGPTDCKLVEIMEGHPNKATYVVSILANLDIEEGSHITACFNNLTLNPHGDNPTVLVEGMWSATFPFHYTVADDIIMENLQGKEFPFINTTAFVERIQITPLGMQILYDVSNLPYEEIAVSDTRINVRLKMIDGSEQIVFSRNDEDVDKFITSSTSDSYEEGEEKNSQRSDFEFSEMQDISKIIGIYIEDLYIPINE